ncbi:MAG TPA: hypothetical protein VMG41_15295 [Gemmatimonadales bacterium]|nr:hypothetical protein [Gemmatimonadales bacterium]
MTQPPRSCRDHVPLLCAVAALAACGGGSTSPTPPEETASPGLIVRSDLGDPKGELYYIRKDGLMYLKLTNDTIHEDQPAVSPDGKKIAYLCEANNNADICLMNIDGSNSVRLTQDTSFDGFPHWTPDGSQITFTSHRGHGDHGNDLWIMDTLGANQHPITNGGDVAYEDGQFDPTGTRLVASRQIDTLPNPDLVFVDAATGNVTPFWQPYVFQELHPTWSPDGKRIAFTATNGGSDFHVEVRDLTGGHPVYLHLISGTLNTPSWSPDGREIAGACANLLVTSVCRFSPSGQMILDLPASPISGFSPAWVP